MTDTAAQTAHHKNIILLWLDVYMPKLFLCFIIFKTPKQDASSLYKWKPMILVFRLAVVVLIDRFFVLFCFFPDFSGCFRTRSRSKEYWQHPFGWVWLSRSVWLDSQTKRGHWNVSFGWIVFLMAISFLQCNIISQKTWANHSVADLIYLMSRYPGSHTEKEKCRRLWVGLACPSSYSKPCCLSLHWWHANFPSNH